MNKLIIFSKILYSLAIVCFVLYLITKGSGYMAGGGLLMIGGAIAMIIGEKKKK